MSFEKEIVEQEIARLEKEKAALLQQQQEYSQAAVDRHRADHDVAIGALAAARDKAGASAGAVLQGRIDRLIGDRDAVKVQDFGPRIAELSRTIGQLRELLEVL